MRYQQAAILCVFTFALATSFDSGDARAAEQRWSRNAGEQGGSYMYTDPDTGKTLLLPRKYLPEDYQPPPSTGPSDERAEALVEIWQGNAKLLVGASVVLGGAYGLFVLVRSFSHWECRLVARRRLWHNTAPTHDFLNDQDQYVETSTHSERGVE